MKAVLCYLKKDVVLCIALILAVVSAFFVPPSFAYLDYIDFRVLGILLSLMCVMEGMKSNGVFDWVGKALIPKCKSQRQLAFTLVFLCFFSSMLLTNDVALITFVPFAILVLELADMEVMVVLVVVLQTLAANLGSMLTPMGNPQNLYLYSASGMDTKEFLLLTMPYVVISAILLCCGLLFVKNRPVEQISIAKEQKSVQLKYLIIDILLFLLSIAAVLHVLPWYLCLLIVGIMIGARNYHLLLRADYGLLLTFIGFFVFIGNMSKIPQINEFLAKSIRGYEFAAATASSQIISNVPAALLLSKFTDRYQELILGTNLGGLGTLIASMASLISYKQVANVYPKKKRQFLMLFTVWNLIFLAILILAKELTKM